MTDTTAGVLFIATILLVAPIVALLAEKWSSKAAEVGYLRATVWVVCWPFHLGRAIASGIILFVLAIPSIIEFMRRVIMDPVNKWLTVVILMFVALISVIGWKSGSGRYEIHTVDSAYESHQIVYVLDTKNGEVTATLHNQEDHFTDAGKLRDYAIIVKKKSDSGRTTYGYNYNRDTYKKNNPNVSGVQKPKTWQQ